MVLRVLDALAASQEVDARLLCGPPSPILESEPVLQNLITSKTIGWLPPQATPSASALSAFEAVSLETPVLLTTADHALLKTEVVDHFCREARATDCDVVAALASYSRVIARYPGMRRTRTRFREGDFCGCNLFAFLTPASRKAADRWRRVENHRKRPLKMLADLGWGVVLRYLLGFLSLQEALSHISGRMGLRAGAVILPFPEAAVDVDSVSDWHFAQAIASRLET